MQKTLTISINEAVYEGLYRMIGKRKISKFIEGLVKPYVLDSSLDSGYKLMAADKEREIEALDWCNSLIGDVSEKR